MLFGAQEYDVDLIVDILEMIHVEEGLFDKPFVTQKAILESGRLETIITPTKDSECFYLHEEK